MSELSRSDQLCLFEYLSGDDESPQSAGRVSSQSDLSEAYSSPITSVDKPPIEESLADSTQISPTSPQGNGPVHPSTNTNRLSEQIRYASKQALQFAARSTQAIEITNVEAAKGLGETIKERYSGLSPQVEPYPPGSLSEEQERIFHLEQALDQALHYLDELNARVKHQAMLEEQVTLTEEYAYVQYQAIARLQEDLAEHKEIISQRNLTIASLESDRTLAQTNLLSLQQDQLNLRQENAQWKNACQELQQECDRQHRKMLALEQENTVMQEQILQQARQSNEHETAVQYWKDRYTAIQQNLQEFQAVLAEKIRHMNDGNEDNGLSHLLTRIQLIGNDDNEAADSQLPTPSLHSFSIPDFLIRRYRQRGTGSTTSRTNNLPSKPVDS